MEKEKLLNELLEEETSKMYLDKDTKILDELAYYYNKFNLDFDTLETMPAFKEHLKPLSNQVKSMTLHPDSD